VKFAGCLKREKTYLCEPLPGGGAGPAYGTRIGLVEINGKYESFFEDAEM